MHVLKILNILFGIEKSFLACVGAGMVINSLGNGGSTRRLFCLSSVLEAKERGGGGVRVRERQWREEGDRETKPEREPMTLKVTHSYHELPQSEGKDNEGFSLPSTARGQPYGHSTFSNPIFCVLRVIICKALVPSEKHWIQTVTGSCIYLHFKTIVCRQTHS